jgi:hypothetical protein
LLSPYIDPGTIDGAGYNHFTLLRSVEDLFGLTHLGYAGLPGARSLGADAFTCYRRTAPSAHHGRLRRGSEIKLAVIGRTAGHRPDLEIKLWKPARITLTVRHGHHRRTIQRKAEQPCGPMTVTLPYQHGRVTIAVRAYRGTERRTLSF